MTGYKLISTRQTRERLFIFYPIYEQHSNTLRPHISAPYFLWNIIVHVVTITAQFLSTKCSLKRISLDWREDSEVQKVHCSPRGPEVGCQQPHQAIHNTFNFSSRALDISSRFLKYCIPLCRDMEK